jgi:GT2 family glycosyltransferase
MISIIIPTYNGENRILYTLDAILKQETKKKYEILVINDGSKDNTESVVKKFADLHSENTIRIINQNNAGPAAARNNGAFKAEGDLLLFTDDDCIPEKDWIEKMITPFDNDKELIGAKGAYKSSQKQLTAKFVQIEYEHKYEKLKKYDTIDTIDTYSAAFRKDVFIEMGGYDVSFPVACAEDFEFSYRLSAKGYKMIFIRDAFVYHTHPDKFWWYMQKKYKFAYWRWLAIRKNPDKLKNDTHTPQDMKIMAILAPVMSFSLLVPLYRSRLFIVPVFFLVIFIITALDFQLYILRKNLFLSVLSPVYIFFRAWAQFLGIFFGFKDVILLKKFDGVGK